MKKGKGVAFPLNPNSEAHSNHHMNQMHPTGTSVERPDPTRPWPALTRPSRATAMMEIALTLSGMALTAYMVLHFGDLTSILIGTEAMDDVAAFMERYYLLQAAAPVLAIILVAHVFLAARKVPTTFIQQWALTRHLRSMRHMDTWTWAFQILSGAALMALVAIHVWTVLSDLPIEASKSSSRVYDVYLWLYVPLILMVVSHMIIGTYRVLVKWGIVSRRLAHLFLLVGTAFFLGLGYAILVTLYQVGSDL